MPSTRQGRRWGVDPRIPPPAEGVSSNGDAHGRRRRVLTPRVPGTEDDVDEAEVDRPPREHA